MGPSGHESCAVPTGLRRYADRDLLKPTLGDAVTSLGLGDAVANFGRVALGGILTHFCDKICHKICNKLRDKFCDHICDHILYKK